jgi:uncharacterized protein YecT (DUF1311 family)
MGEVTQDRTAVLEATASVPASFETADQALNTVYQDLQAALTPEDQDSLTDAQLAWLDYRDAHCEFENTDTDTCLAIVTAQQTQQLQTQLASRSM